MPERNDAVLLALLPLAAVIAFSFASLQEAFAANYVISDQASCENFPLGVGDWSSGTCEVFTFSIGVGDNVTVTNGVTLFLEGNGGTLGNNGTLQINSNASFSMNDLSSDIFNYGTIINAGTINNLQGTIYNYGGTIENTGRIENAGLIEIDADGNIENAGNLTNTGDIENSGNIASTGRIKNNAGGTIENLLSSIISTIDNSGTIDNEGTINNENTIDNTGTFTNSGSIDNTGTIDNSGNLTNTGDIDSTFEIDNTGTFTNAGTLHNDETLLNDGSLRNTGTITNDDTFNNRNNATFTNDGTMVNNDFFQIIESTAVNSGTVTNNGDFSPFSGVYTNNGTMDNLDGRIIVGPLLNFTNNEDIYNNATIRILGLLNNTSADTIENDCGGIINGNVTGIAAEDACAPSADSQSVTIDEDEDIVINLNGTNPDADSDFAAIPLQFTVVTQPSSGTLTGANSTLTYTPYRHFDGEDSFTFVANDGTNDSPAATVSITVNSDDNHNKRRGDDRSVVVNQQGGEDSVGILPDSYFAENPLDRIGISNPGLLGAGIHSAAGQQVSIAGTLSNHQKMAQAYAFIVQIIDDKGAVVHIDWQDGNIESGATAEISLSWTPETAGDYAARIFVWDGLQSQPSPLSPVSAMNIEVEQ